MKFAHIADTHIRNLKYHYEYKAVFEALYARLKEEGVDCIVHCGDIAHTKTQISPEFVEMCADFFRNLANIAPTYIILGNHDGNLRNTSRQDALTPIADALDLPNLHLLKDSGEIHLDGGFNLNVMSVFDEDNWVTPSDPNKINIALYHGSVSGCKTDAGWTMEYGEHEISIFEEFDYAFLGDIHKTNQVLDIEGRIRYPGSTVQQNHGETNNKGFLIWDIEDKDTFSCEHYILDNPKPFVTIDLTPKGKVPKGVKVSEGARLRLVSNNNLPLDSMRRAVDVAKARFKPESITFLNRAAGQYGSVEDLTDGLKLEDLRNIAVQEELISEYLKDYQVESETLDRVYAMNKKYNSMAEENEEIARNINWRLTSLKWDNLFNYGEENSIDFTNLNGIVGIFGKNFSGKSSIIDSFLYTLFNSTSKNVRKNLNIINQTKRWGGGEVTIDIGNKSYTVERKSEKYLRKLHGEETIEAKTDVEFYNVDAATQETVSLNGLTRAGTDENIRRVFGSLEDFLLTSMASQLGSLAFISEGSTRRKEILAKFLDLEIFDKKYKLAKDDASDLKGAIKLLEGREFDLEIGEAKQLLFKNEARSLKHQNTCDDIKKKIKKEERKLKKMVDKVEAVPTDPIDIKECLNKKEQLDAQQKEIEKENQSSALEIEQKNSFTEKAEKFLCDFDLEALRAKKQIAVDKAQELDDLSRKVEGEERTLDTYCSRAKTLEGVPCGSQFVTSCKFIKDAYKASKMIDGVENNIADLEQEKKARHQEIISLDMATVEEHIANYDRLLKKKSNAEGENVKTRLDIERNNNQLFSIAAAIADIQKDIDYYYQNQEAIENYKELVRGVEMCNQSLLTFESDLGTCETEVLELYKVHGSVEQNIKNLQEQKDELQQLREDYEAYDLYMKCVHSNGIAYDIIKRKLPTINNEIAKILTNIVTFEVFLEDDGRKLDMYIKHPRFEPRPLELGSGAEKTISAMAIRLALLNVSSLPKGNIFILDEPGSALDEENMEGFVRMMDMVKGHFKTVLLISHLDSLKDCVDTQLVIDKKGGFAYINQ
jgi:DNA repair exonuclease SbcCD ATPase subunit/DNA repair exonuclease SbcCD nuclease subunit